MKQFRSLKSNAGFTLIEMAIVSIVVGILFASLAYPYSLYIKKERLTETTTRLTVVSQAVTDFLSVNGRYPCPARTDLPRDDGNFGREGNCTDVSQAPATCVDGICIQRNDRAVTDPITGVVTNISPRVRTGALPFRQLNLTEADAYDGYGGQYTYSVTEALAVAATFDSLRGGIDIIDAAGNSVLTPVESAHFIVISAGPDQAGATTNQGAAMPCNVGTLDEENCNPGEFAVFRRAEFSDDAGGNHFDDFVSFFSADEIPLWKVAATPFDIVQIPTGGSLSLLEGSDPSPSTAMDVNKIEVAGSVRVSGDPSNGQAKVGQVCADGATDCFLSQLIAGDEADMQCDPGEIAQRIRGGEMRCVPLNSLTFTCPAHLPYMRGVNADGSLECTAAIPISCSTETRSLCGTNNLSLTAGADGVVRSFNEGFCRRISYRCNAGSWDVVSGSEQGSCEQYQTDAAGLGCGNGYFPGTRDRGTREFNCSTNRWGAWTNGSGYGTCVCDITATRDDRRACPPGFSGSSHMPQTRTCAPIDWVDNPPLVSACSCTPSGPHQTPVDCPGNLSGTRFVDRHQYVCSPGRTYQALPDDNSGCYCDPARTRPESRDCPAGYDGQIIDTYRSNCPGTGWTLVGSDDSACTVTPPVTCTWHNSDTTNDLDSDMYSANQKGAECSCSITASARCFERIATDTYKNYSNCYCR